MKTVPALLVLEDGKTFHGESFGAQGETIGHAFFSTAMTGYQEGLTDPGSHQSVIIATAPHVGNTGWNDDDNESGRIWAAGLVVRDPSPRPSSWRATRSLVDEMTAQSLVGIAGIDTRALTTRLRDHGTMKVGISTTDLDPGSLLAKVRAWQPGNPVADVTTAEPYVVPSQGEKSFTIAVVDLGMKAMAARIMAAKGMDVHVLPATATLADIQAVNPDGVVFAGGPGDPAALSGVIDCVGAVLAAKIPVFAIGLGAQVFGLALGLTTYPLKHGHHGTNIPVKDLATSKVWITAHGHSHGLHAPASDEIPTAYGTLRVTHRCINDQVAEGLHLLDDGVVVGMAVQFHPESGGGPHETSAFFDQFSAMMTTRRASA
ncbi:MAG: glutamine-hydrolyzing carbamoyl-phosphate synthase small subunit [Propionibacteriaceae bacterium]|nr:glutamine-hydrolyzing carbamoyl-phosphate synthase small subunit [Propionibacteriaceae bacterium]